MNKDLEQDNKQLSIELNQMRYKIAKQEDILKRVSKQLEEREQRLKITKQQLTDRTKELNCLFSISRTIETPNITLEEIFRKANSIISESWKYSEFAVCRIILHGIEYKSDKFQQTRWSQSSNIVVNGKPIGVIQVCYLEELPQVHEDPFLREERLLLNAMAKRFSAFIQHKESNQALKESEQKHRNQASFLNDIIEKSPFAMWISDTDGTLVRANQALRDMLNITDQMIVGKYNVLKDQNLHNQGLIPGITSVFKEFKTIRFIAFWEGDKVGDIELSAIDTDRLWLDVSLFPITDETGKLTNVICQYVDITNIKKTEQALLESEEKMSSIFRVAPTGIGVIKDRIIFDVNPRICEITGYSKKELIGRSARILYPTDKEYEYVGTEKYRQINLRGTGTVETLWKKKDGSILNILLSSTPINIDNYSSGVTFTALNITDRKRAEEELGKLSVAVQQSPAIIVITDLNGEIEYVNPKFSETTGYSKRELEGKSVNILRKDNSSDEINRELWSTISKGKVWNGEFQVKRKDGGIFWERASISPIRNDKDQIINYIKIAENISEIKLKEQKLKAALKKAKESDQLKSAFLSNMSHEIRTPMNGILGFTNLLKDPQLTGKKMDKYIQIIEKSGKRMLNTINDIIDISRIEAGQVEITNQKVSVNQLLEEQHAFFIREAELKGLNLTYKSGHKDMDVHLFTDKHKMEGILSNLIKNAIKFTKHGTISFGYSLKKESDFEGVEFYIKDTGIGIPSDRIDAIFNRFEQADIQDLRVYEGSGLGLAISKSYIEMLGGNIRVSSKEGIGSTFIFTIPYTNKITNYNDDKEGVLFLP